MTLEKRSGEVLAMLSGMKQEFAGFDAAVQRMRQRLAQAEGELDGLERQARRVLRMLEAVHGDEF